MLVSLRNITCNEEKNASQNKELEAFNILYIGCYVSAIDFTQESYPYVE